MTTTTERFWVKVNKTDDCWEWLGATNDGGYGRFRLEGHWKMAHRYAYETLVGPIPEGVEPDHLCRNRICTKPEHMELVTHAINVARGLAGKYQSRRTHCAQGHLFDLFNTYFYKGHRQCKACNKIVKARTFAQETCGQPGGVLGLGG